MRVAIGVVVVVEWMGVGVWVNVCVCEREREGERVCVWVWVFLSFLQVSPSLLPPSYPREEAMPMMREREIRYLTCKYCGAFRATRQVPPRD